MFAGHLFHLCKVPDLTEVSIKQALEAFTMSCLISGDLMNDIMDRIQIQFFCFLSQFCASFRCTEFRIGTKLQILLCGIRNNLTQKLCKMSCMPCLLDGCLFKKSTDFRISLTDCNTAHSQIHTDLAALAVKHLTKTILDLIRCGICHTDHVLCRPCLLLIHLFELGSLTFEKPDIDTFRGLKLAYDSARAGGSMPTVFNAVNEMAVKRFLKGDIRYLEIYDMIEEAMEHHARIENPDVQAILAAEAETYRFLSEKYKI